MINSFAFTLLIARTDSDWPRADFEQWTSAFVNTYPHAQLLSLDKERRVVADGGDHAISNIAPL